MILLGPTSADDLVAQFDILFEPVLVREAVEVVKYFLRGGVYSRPVELGLETPSVIM